VTAQTAQALTLRLLAWLREQRVSSLDAVPALLVTAAKLAAADEHDEHAMQSLLHVAFTEESAKWRKRN
jgi:hypothetical protein